MVIFNSYVKLPEGNESVWKSFVQPMFSMFFGFQKLIQQKWPVSPIPHFAAGSFIHMACALNCTSEKTQQLRMLMITVKQDSVSHFSYWYRIGNHDATDDHYHSFNISYIYIWLYMYDICMKKSNFSFHWLLVSCHVVTKAHCAFHADFQGELDIHLQWKMATAKGYPVFDGHFNGKMLRPVRSPERNAWGYSNPFVSDNQHTTEPASKKKNCIFSLVSKEFTVFRHGFNMFQQSTPHNFLLFFPVEPSKVECWEFLSIAIAASHGGFLPGWFRDPAASRQGSDKN